MSYQKKRVNSPCWAYKVSDCAIFLQKLLAIAQNSSVAAFFSSRLFNLCIQLISILSWTLGLWFFKRIYGINICVFNWLNHQKTGSEAGGSNLRANYFLPARVRDWKGERILKKCAKTNACVWSEANAVALESTTCRKAGHTQIFMKITKKRIFWWILICWLTEFLILMIDMAE